MKPTVRRSQAHLKTAAKSLQRQLNNRSEDDLRISLGRIETRQIRQLPSTAISDANFGVFSQWGEDGIIQFILEHCEIGHETFVEIGTEDYRQSNTRFLVEGSSWRGLAIDGGTAHVDFITSSGLSWKYGVTGVSSFVTAENIDQTLKSNATEGEIGLLSVDIDGVDYWVLESISTVDPQIVIVEYNGFYGSELALTVPYDPSFVRNEYHDSNFYWGASLAAFDHQLSNRGYGLVACNRAGNNAFFVRNDCLGAMTSLSVAEAYQEPRYWEYFDPTGEPFPRDMSAMFRRLGDLTYVDVRANETRTAQDVAAAL